MDSQLESLPIAFKSFQNSLRGGSAALFGGLMLGNLIAYVYQMLMARMMSPAEYGILVTLTSISYVLTILMRTFQAWVIKAVAATQIAGTGQIRPIFIGAMRTLAPLGAVAFICHWFAGGWTADFLHLSSTTPVIVLGLYTASSFLIPAPRGVLMGMNRLHVSGLIQVIEPVARLVGGLLLVRWGFGANGAISGFAFGNLVAFVVAMLLIWPLLRRSDNQTPSSSGFSGLDRYALLMLVINSCLMVISSVDQIAVKHFFSDHVAGNYAVAFLLGRVITMSTMALGWVIFTRSATLAPGDPRHLQLFRKGMLLMGSIAVLLAIGYIVAPVLAVRLMGGSQYDIANGYVGLVGVEMTLFAFVYLQAYYQISIKKMQVVWPLITATIIEMVLLAEYHATVQQVLLSLIFVMVGLLVCVSGLSWWILRAPTRSVASIAREPSETAVNIT